MNKNISMLLGIFSIAGLFSNSVSAEGPGSVDVKADYDNVAQTLTVDVTNTSLSSNGGYITAIAIDNPNDLISNVSSYSSSNNNFSLIDVPSYTSNSIAINPFGSYDIGFSTAANGSWLGGGKPSGGTAVGATDTFTLKFEGNSLGSLSLDDFGSLAIRMRGFNDGGSDKILTPFPIVTPVPEASTWVMMSLGVLMIGYATRRKLKNEDRTSQLAAC